MAKALRDSNLLSLRRRTDALLVQLTIYATVIYLGGTDDYVPLKSKSKKKENIKDGPRLTREEDEEDFDENGKFSV